MFHVKSRSPKLHSTTLFGFFSSRGTLHDTIDVLREEGFRSTELSVMLAISLADEVVVSEHDYSRGWLRGVIAHIFSFKSTSEKTQLRMQSEPTRVVRQFIKNGGIILSIFAADESSSLVASEVLEDAGIRFVTIRGRLESSDAILRRIHTRPSANDDSYNQYSLTGS